MIVLNRIKGMLLTLFALGVPVGGAVALSQRPSKPPDRAVEARPAPPPPAAPTKLAYGDGQADGKKSLGGSGELIEFTLPAADRKVAGLRIHGSRYGQESPPPESFLIYFLNEDQTEVVATRLAPYALFERGDERWVDIPFATPVSLPGRFWVALDFRPTPTKGVYLSFDASTAGKHSRTGLPGIRPRKIDYGDWMVEVALAP